MKTGTATKGLYLGAGAGLILFAIIGLLPGSFIGGVVGINIAGKLFGLPLGTELAPRVVVGMCMVLGVMISGIIFVVGTSILGWIGGRLIDSVKVSKTAASEVKVKS